eukprot:196992_1
MNRSTFMMVLLVLAFISNTSHAAEQNAKDAILSAIREYEFGATMEDVGVLFTEIARILRNDANALDKEPSRIPALLDIPENEMNNLNALEKTHAGTVLNKIQSYLEQLPLGQQNAEHLKKIQELKKICNP